MRWKEKIINIKLFVLLIQRIWTKYLFVGKREMIWGRRELLELGIDMCVGLVDWGYSRWHWQLACLLQLCYSIGCGVLKRRCGGSWFIMFLLWWQYTWLAPFILYLYFFEGICFVNWMWCSEPLCREHHIQLTKKKMIIFIFAFLVFKSSQQVEWVR